MGHRDPSIGHHHDRRAASVACSHDRRHGLCSVETQETLHLLHQSTEDKRWRQAEADLLRQDGDVDRRRS